MQVLPAVTPSGNTDAPPAVTTGTGVSAEVIDSNPSPSDSAESDENRGFFFNTESGALGDLGESLDPTTLTVLGILITLAATAIQLVKGN